MREACDAETMLPRLVIELDDASHQRRSARQRDRAKDDILQGAGVTVLRIKAQRAYDLKELEQQLATALEPPSSVESPEADEPVAATEEVAASVPAGQDGQSCPKCGADMVPRVARQGTNKGQAFWGCSRYPQCRAVVAAARS